MEKFTIVEWKENYSVGIKVIDDQHRQLIKMTNELFNGCMRGDKEAKLYFAKTIHKAVDYVREHFNAEELILLQTGYPDYKIHKKEHEDFIQTILIQVKAFEEGKKFVPNQFARYLRDWVLSHIAVSDHLYAEYFAKQKC